MELLEALILGIIQGLTEFLPVSSSGHLEIVKAFFGDNMLAKESMLMTVILHFATALSTVVIFRKDLKEIFVGLFQLKNNDAFKFSLKIVISMIPAAIVGVMFNDEIEKLFGGAITLVGFMLIITGILLFLTDKAKQTSKQIGPVQAVIIGVSQAIAILPGISRSGATISTAVLLGVDKGKAARFSFLMVVPLIFGKMAKDIFSGEINFENTNLMPLFVGFMCAFITGMLACKWMIKIVKNSKLIYFSIYCFIVGISVIIVNYIFNHGFS